MCLACSLRSSPCVAARLQSYADVATEQGVDTAQFLEATEGVIKLFDLLGSSAFVIVQTDMKGNVKVRAWEWAYVACMQPL